MEAVDGARRVIVVGGASGIGEACVRHLAGSGTAVLCADLRVPPPDLPLAGSVTVDVRDADAVEAAIAALAADAPVDGLVYAAGIGHVAPLQEITPARWRLVLDVNLTGAFHCARAIVQHVANPAALVFISSIDSEAPVAGLAHYCASKAGLESLSRSLALELAARGVRSNVVAPGPVRTPLMADFYRDPKNERAFTSRTPLGRIADPSDVAKAVSFLLSPAASHITGARIPVDGGMSLREHPSMLDIEKGTQ